MLLSIPEWIDFICINKLCYLPDVKQEVYIRPNLLIFVYTVNTNSMIPDSKVDGIISDCRYESYSKYNLLLRIVNVNLVDFILEFINMVYVGV